MFHKDGQHLHRDPVAFDFDVQYSCRRRCLHHMTTFGLTDNKAGELQIVLQQGHSLHSSGLMILRSDLWSLWHSGSEFEQNECEPVVEDELIKMY
jgi:hypothetical protein